MGATRVHRCQCREGLTARVDCPVHSIWDQILLLQRHFPDKWVRGRPALDLPLFPTTTGGVVTKEAALGTILWAARALQVPLSSSDGAERISGHSLRVTGAQGLAAQDGTMDHPAAGGQRPSRDTSGNLPCRPTLAQAPRRPSWRPLLRLPSEDPRQGGTNH